MSANNLPKPVNKIHAEPPLASPSFEVALLKSVKINTSKHASSSEEGGHGGQLTDIPRLKIVDISHKNSSIDKIVMGTMGTKMFEMSGSQNGPPRVETVICKFSLQDESY